jgi:hypothetical protein
MVVEQELYRVRGYLNLIALLLLYGGLIIIEPAGRDHAQAVPRLEAPMFLPG